MERHSPHLIVFGIALWNCDNRGGLVNLLTILNFPVPGGPSLA
jgi:hypothetical protein